MIIFSVSTSVLRENTARIVVVVAIAKMVRLVLMLMGNVNAVQDGWEDFASNALVLMDFMASNVKRCILNTI